MITGVWVPLVTPFKDGAVDLVSYRRLIEHYIGKGVSGLFPLGTTGEAPTIDDDEEDAIVAETIAVVAGRVRSSSASAAMLQPGLSNQLSVSIDTSFPASSLSVPITIDRRKPACTSISPPSRRRRSVKF